MASRLVPDFPAVLVALEHMKELDKELKDEGVAFSPEASALLIEITSALTGLEAERRAAHEHLEVATIENSKLRHEMNSTRDQMSAVVVADVAAARTANAEEIERLRKELHAVSQIQEETVKRHETVFSENELLSIEREKFKGKHQEAIAVLNSERTQKYTLQSHLRQTREHIEELKVSIASLENDTARVQEDLAFKRDAFVKGRDDLSNDFAEIEKRIKCQEQEILCSRKQLELLGESHRDGNYSLDELRLQTVQVENSIQRLRESKSRCEKRLEAEKEKYKELLARKEALEKQLDGLIKFLEKTITRLKEEIAAIEEKMVGARALRLRIQGNLDKVYEIFKVHDDEETEVRTEYDYVSGLLEKSRMQLDERIGSIVRHKKEMDEMKKQIEALKEEDLLNKRMFDRDQGELCDKIEEEKQHTEVFEDDKRHLLKLMEENKGKQEEYVKTMTAQIKATRRKVKELQTEESALKKKQPMTPEEIRDYMTKSRVEYEHIESVCREEIQRCSNDIDSVTKTCEEKQKQVAEKQEVLKAVEAEWKEEVDRHGHLKKQQTLFKMKKCELEESIEELKKETALLLEPKDQKKAELESAWAEHKETLSKQATEMKSVEMCIYNSSVKLEEVQVENSRLHLRVNNMTQDMTKAEEDKEWYKEETVRIKRDTEILYRSLQEALREGALLTQERHSADAALMAPMDELQNHLKTRGQHLTPVQTMVHGQMMDFSRRLGDQITVDPQS